MDKILRTQLKLPFLFPAEESNHCKLSDRLY
jgi:hypothetical protein